MLIGIRGSGQCSLYRAYCVPIPRLLQSLLGTEKKGRIKLRTQFTVGSKGRRGVKGAILFLSWVYLYNFTNVYNALMGSVHSESR